MKMKKSTVIKIRDIMHSIENLQARGLYHLNISLTRGINRTQPKKSNIEQAMYQRVDTTDL